MRISWPLPILPSERNFTFVRIALYGLVWSENRGPVLQCRPYLVRLLRSVIAFFPSVVIPTARSSPYSWTLNHPLRAMDRTASLICSWGICRSLAIWWLDQEARPSKRRSIRSCIDAMTGCRYLVWNEFGTPSMHRFMFPLQEVGRWRISFRGLETNDDLISPLLPQLFSEPS